MILAAYTFDGDPDALLECHHEMMDLFPPDRARPAHRRHDHDRASPSTTRVPTSPPMRRSSPAPSSSGPSSRSACPRRAIEVLGEVHFATMNQSVHRDDRASPDLDGHRAGASWSARGEVTPAELVEAAIERIETLNPTLNAVVTPMFERALERTRGADRQVRSPACRYLLKDLAAEVEGVRFTEGSRFLRRQRVDLRPPSSSAASARPGWSIVGKTNTPEFGMAPACEPALFGPTRNPWDLDAVDERIERRLGRRGRVGHGADRPRQRPRRLDPLPGSATAGCSGLKPTRARNPLGPEYGDVGQRVGGRARAHPVRARQRRAARRHQRARCWATRTGAAARAGRSLDEVGADPGPAPHRLHRAAPRRSSSATPTASPRSTKTAALLAELGHEVVEARLPPFTAEDGGAPSASCSTPRRRGSSTTG